MLRACAFLLPFVLLTSCVTASHHPRVSAVQALDLANAEARRRGYDLTSYKQPEVCYNCLTPNDTWRVIYERKRLRGKRAGNHIDVVIDGTTKKIWGFVVEDDSTPIIRLPAGTKFVYPP